MMQNFANTRALDEIYRPSLAENVTKWCKTLQVQEHLSNLPTITCWKCYKIMQTLQIKEDLIKFADHHLLGMLQNNANFANMRALDQICTLTDHLAIHICTKCIIFHIDMDFWDQVGYQDTAYCIMDEEYISICYKYCMNAESNI